MSYKTSDGIMLTKPAVDFVNRTPSSAGLVTPADASIVSRQGQNKNRKPPATLATLLVDSIHGLRNAV